MTPSPGFYIGGEGGLNWMFNTTANVPGFGGAVNIYPATGWAAGGMIGYDFVGPRVELEGIYRSNQATLQAAPIGFQQFTAGANFNDTAIMANVLYDFRFGWPIVPYIGGGARHCLRQCVRPERQHVEHAVRLSGHHRRGLRDRPELALQCRRPLLRHDQPDDQQSVHRWRHLLQQQHLSDGEHPVQVRRRALRRLRRRRRRWFLRRRSWCSSIGIARTSRSRR